jgi:FdhE protein
MNSDTTQAKLKHIHDSFQAARESLPAYRHILPFFESLFTLQEAAVPVTSPEPVQMTPQVRAARLEGQLPLMDRGRLPYDKPAALDLLQAICREAATATPELAAGAKTIKAVLEEKKTAIEYGFDLFVGADLQGIRDLSAAFSMDASILLFFLQHSTWPAIARQANLMSDSNQAMANWDHGYCPVCGNPPSLAFLAENGARFLVCEFCRHQWPFKRILCPSCGNADAKSISYFFSEEEQTYRVYTCDACRKYLKAVDTRRLTRPFYPPLESLVTTHLDLQAQEMGYQSVTSEAIR